MLEQKKADVRVDIRYDQLYTSAPFFFLFTLSNSGETMTRHESTGNMQQKTSSFSNLSHRKTGGKNN